MWDPFVILCLPHDPHLRGRQVRRAYGAARRRLAWITDPDLRQVAAWRAGVAYGALRTRGQRHQVLTNLAVQPGWYHTLTHADVKVMAEALLPPLLDSGLDLEEALDRRALARTAAGLRLERTATDVLAWPRTSLGRGWARARYGWPG